jgi:hypothetical protein
MGRQSHVPQPVRVYQRSRCSFASPRMHAGIPNDRPWSLVSGLANTRASFVFPGGISFVARTDADIRTMPRSLVSATNSARIDRGAEGASPATDPGREC